METAPVGRPRDPEVDRRIAQAALDVFAEAGWSGFAMETVARRAGVGKASLYLRWSSKEAMLADALTLRIGRVADVDTGTLPGDLTELAAQVLRAYAGDTGRAALRLTLEAATIPSLAGHYDAMRTAEIGAARAIVRRGIARSELPAGTSVTLLLNTLIGGAMMRALTSPADKRPMTARDIIRHARQLVDFLLNAVTTSALQ
ncbi:AcrR family transcriptional regulator [Actinoplanes tereljensis]|nr:TetR/AcrR family transcriptional regulator [Actinoplanes tereljensis]